MVLQIENLGIYRGWRSPAVALQLAFSAQQRASGVRLFKRPVFFPTAPRIRQNRGGTQRPTRLNPAPLHTWLQHARTVARAVPVKPSVDGGITERQAVSIVLRAVRLCHDDARSTKENR